MARVRKPRPGSKVRVALCAWEIGRVQSGFGTKIGGLGSVVEELPPELVRAAARQGMELEIVTLSPCFAHYDRTKLTKLDVNASAIIEGVPFLFDVYEHVFTEKLAFPDGSEREVSFRMVYFWDLGQLSWTNGRDIYPSDPWMGAKLYSAVCQGMAAYIAQGGFHTVHLHDYHVGLVPFFLDDEFLERVPLHFTIHNATYQGITPLIGGGYATLARLNLHGEKLFHKYFDFFDNLNLMKACLLRVHELGGKVTTVSGDLAATWGYAAELRECHREVYGRAWAQKGVPPGEVFVPNRHLDLFEKIPVAGITNGLRDANRPEHMPELQCSVLQARQAQRPDRPLFANPAVQAEMLARDHTYDVERLEVKERLRRLLYLECFGHELWGSPIVLTAVGRLVDQKNFGLIAEIIPRTLAADNQAKFILLASANNGDSGGKALEARFYDLARRYPGQVYFNNGFNPVFAKLIFAGGDFTLIPSRFEPCGLTDYEAAWLGTLTIARRTGGLAKIAACGYLYDWLDIRDWPGEATAFFGAIQAALGTYRNDPVRHQQLLRAAMALNAGWEEPAAQYIRMYRFGFLSKKWRGRRNEVVEQFIKSLGTDRAIFRDFFAPGAAEYGDKYDWELKRRLSTDR